MKDFLIKTSIFSLVVLTIFLLLLSRADGRTDNFYLRFTTPVQKSMIVGTSRAAQGLLPAVFDSINSTEMYNYSFTVNASPYGETYLNSIKKKIDKKSSAGTFIVTVDPWSICSSTENPEDSTQFRELDLYLAKTPFVTHNPNFLYLLKNLKGQYFYTVYKRQLPTLLHNDGWLEISVSMHPNEVKKRTDKRLGAYREGLLTRHKFSKTRLRYLKETISFLNQHGDVYLVRLPVHPEMMKMEIELMPNFDDHISNLIPSTKGYLDLTKFNSDYRYVDGNHLYKESGRRVSEKVALWVRELKDQ
jgi:hypothetical protein